MKTKEEGIRKPVKMKDNNITGYDYEHIGPEDSNKWQEWVKDIVHKAKKGTDIIQPANNETEFIDNCKKLGLKITYPDRFLKIYYKRK